MGSPRVDPRRSRSPSSDEDTRQLEALLASLSSQSHSPSLIIIIDDGSPIFPSLPKYPDVQILHLPKNLGPAGTRNAGIRRALELDQSLQAGKGYIFLTDLDCLLSAKWIETGLKALESHRRLTSPLAGLADPSVLEPILIAGKTI